MDIEKRCCFTGHRDINSDFKPKMLEECIEALYNSGVDTFISGGAIGFDMLAGFAVLELKKKHPDIKLWLFLPCLDQDTMWNGEQRKMRQTLIESADYVHCPEVKYNKTVMKERNYRMVDACSCCVSYFNGKFVSGTAQTIRYALRSGKEVINLGTFDLADFK